MTEGSIVSALPLAPSTRIPELDGLRGIAIGLVLFWHYFVTIAVTRPGSALACLQASGRLAGTGVDLFFVLSGFLIGGILLDARTASNYFRVFYTRRFLRIIPLYAVCLFGTFLLVPWLRGVHSGSAFRLVWSESAIPWYSYPVFLQNLWIAVKGSFGQPGLTVTWSLAVEEQFYLTLPFVIRFFEGRRQLLLILVGIVAAPLSRILLYSVWSGQAVATVVLMPCRADALLLGVLGAVLIRSALWKERLQQNRRIMQLLLGCLAAGVIVLTVLEKHHEELRWITVGHTWMAAFYWSVLMYAVINQRSWLSWFLRWGWLGWLGGIAYGTYLFHMYALLLVFRAFFPGDSTGQFVVNGPAQWGVIGVALFATLVLCRFSWLYFEKPLLQLGHRAKYEFAATRHADASSPLA